MKNATFVTGSASGLGFELAKLFGSEKHDLVLVDMNEEGLMKAKEEIHKENPSITIYTFKANLGNKEEMKKAFEFTKENDLFIDNLVNAAGFGDRCDFKEMDIDKQLLMTEVNCNAVLYFTRVFLDDMLKNNTGHIINVSSIAGFLPGPYMCTYHATKGFVLLLGESISRELKGTDVHLLTLCPGPFKSNFVKLAHNDYTFSKIKPVTAKTVAEFAYAKSKKNKTLAIVGFKNRCTIFFSRFFSRKFVTNQSAKTMKKDA